MRWGSDTRHGTPTPGHSPGHHTSPPDGVRAEEIITHILHYSRYCQIGSSSVKTSSNNHKSSVLSMLIGVSLDRVDLSILRRSSVVYWGTRDQLISLSKLIGSLFLLVLCEDVRDNSNTRPVWVDYRVTTTLLPINMNYRVTTTLIWSTG